MGFGVLGGNISATIITDKVSGEKGEPCYLHVHHVTIVPDVAEQLRLSQVLAAAELPHGPQRQPVVLHGERTASTLPQARPEE